MRFPVLSFAATLVILATSCEVKFDWPWLKDRPESGSASGMAVNEDRTVGAFTSLRMEGMGNLVFDPALPPGIVRITADASWLNKIRTQVSGSRLTISEEGLHSLGPVDLEFRVAPPPGLSEVTLAGLGRILSEAPLKASTLDLSLEGLGQIEVNVEADVVTVRQQGSGELVVRGTAGRVAVTTSGLGRVDTNELVTAEADVQSSGVGEVEVFSSGKLKVRASGMGAIRFSGHPATTDVQNSGLSQVTAAD